MEDWALPDRRFLSYVVLCIMVACACGCHKENEQDNVKKVITGVQKAAEEKDVRKIMNSLSKNYRDPLGNTYDEMKGLALAYFYQYPKISMYIPTLDVSVEGGSAKALFQAVLTGRSANDASTAVLPESFDMYAFEVTLKKESGAWKIVSATWARVGDATR
jgi:hypothetical protein